MTESERLSHAKKAGLNVLLLSAQELPFDFFSDVAHHHLVPANGRGPGMVTSDELADAMAPITGTAKLTFAVKGRSAEHALIQALDLEAAPIVLSHGLFATTKKALARRNADLRDLRVTGHPGTADIDLDHLDELLKATSAPLVYLETANQALCGWPLGESNVASVREICDRHGAKLIIDAARVLTNALGLGVDDLTASASRILSSAHAFTISCAKEFLTPVGSVVGSSDAELIGRVERITFDQGTSLGALDPTGPRADLRDGIRYALSHPQFMRSRHERINALAARLKADGIDIVEPWPGNAVFVRSNSIPEPEHGIPAMMSYLTHLYVVAGIRAQVSHPRLGPAIRLTLPLMQSLSDSEISAMASGLRSFLARANERTSLRELPGQQERHPYLRRFEAI